ncbi:MAG TPA: FUSC family membrane protein [Sphingobacteriaceae bacterium]|nr:FUSC family membrane protein [Sphingobacteriaceae bacterium]
MGKTREIQSFFYGQYFADGVRISLGTLIPAFLFTYFGNIQVGITVSLGALMVGLADTPGPASHRRNGMFICLTLVILTALIVNLINSIPFLLLAGIIIISFSYSMFAVYGARAATIGAMGMLAMILNTDTLEGSLLTILEHTLYILIGGAWYLIMSVSVTQVRPFRLAQQELSESIHNVAAYIRTKSRFYDPSSSNQENFTALIEQQILVNEHQENVREILFRSKRIIRDTTRMGRLLILIFTDIIDLFEQSMATHYDYDTICEKFAHTGVMKDIEITIIRIANELDNLAYEINANRTPKPLYNLKEDLERVKQTIDEIEKNEGLNTLPLKKILINARNLNHRIDHIYSYFTLETAKSFRGEEVDYSKFINQQTFDRKILRENLTLQSSTFRHALRMAIVMGLGYLISLYFNVGTHSYWILLTIMVILKPGFGLTKQRNFQRLTGTIIGGIGGAIIVMLIHDQFVLFTLLLLMMMATYSLIRINYIVSVMFMTPYVLILFSFFEENTLMIVQERIFDTMIGSGLAFFSSYILFPNWESSHLNSPMRKLLIANYRYIGMALQIIAGDPPSVTAFKLARKEVYVATANMGSAFQRLITEPKAKQKDAKKLNKFVVLNHIFSSFAVTVLNQVRQADNSALTKEQVKLIRKTLYLLAQSIKSITSEEDMDNNVEVFTEIEVSIPEDLDHNNMDSEEQKLITEQLQFIQRIASDLNKMTSIPTKVTSP